MKPPRIARRPVTDLPVGRAWILRACAGWSVIWRKKMTGDVTFETFTDHKRAMRFADALTWGSP